MASQAAQKPTEDPACVQCIVFAPAAVEGVGMVVIGCSPMPIILNTD